MDLSLSNQQRLVLLGQAMFGPRYKRPLAKALGYDPKMVRLWAANKPEPPDAVVVKCIRLAKGRLKEIEAAYERARVYWSV